MGTQLRTIALATATVVVMGALLVLFVRVRSEPEIEVPEEALSMARAAYEQARSRAGEPHTAFAAATRPSQHTSADEPSVGDRRSRRVEVRPASGSPAASPPSAGSGSGSTMVAQNDVRTAYDHGDFESALDLAEKLLRQNPKDEYVKRVAVVAACALGEEAVAQKHYSEMIPRDQPVVAKRCSRYGVQF